MFAVMIEAEPRKEQWDAYRARTNMLRPELEQAPGFVDYVRYKSLTRDRWILSLSGWRDETSVIGWHTRMRDDEARWNQMLADYRLRLGEVTSDTNALEAQTIGEQEAAETRIGEGTYVTLINAKQTPEWLAARNPPEMALYLGFDLNSYGDCISWDIFDSLSSPGEIVLLVTWKDAESANDHAATQIVPDDARVRVVRIVQDDAMSARHDTSKDHPNPAIRA